MFERTATEPHHLLQSLVFYLLPDSWRSPFKAIAGTNALGLSRKLTSYSIINSLILSYDTTGSGSQRYITYITYNLEQL